jgi:DNA replication and repair protein RecF
MHVSSLSLVSFRSYDSADISFNPGINVLIGTNGQGKTNVVEALAYLAGFSSHRVASDVPLIKQNHERAIVKATIEDDGRSVDLEIEINPSKSNKAKLNGSSVPRTRDILGVLLTVLFAPEDLALVKGDPSERRKFLDDTLTMITPSFSGPRGDYERVLRQRNALLKSAYGNKQDVHSTLDVWDHQLASLGAQVIYERLQLVQQLTPFVDDAYTTVSLDRGPFNISYKSSVDIETDSTVQDIQMAMLNQLALRRKDELDRGITLIGPHRDELELELRGLPVRGYASHGESWSCALALKVAVFHLLRKVSRHGDPILILDDVFAELDEVRREQLLTVIQGCEQTIVTAAVGNDVPQQLNGTLFTVADGKVVRND